MQGEIYAVTHTHIYIYIFTYTVNTCFLRREGREGCMQSTWESYEGIIPSWNLSGFLEPTLQALHQVARHQKLTKVIEVQG
jgi:hypothetical protein